MATVTTYFLFVSLVESKNMFEYDIFCCRKNSDKNKTSKSFRIYGGKNSFGMWKQKEIFLAYLFFGTNILI